MNELMMCPLPFMVSVKDSWAEEDEVREWAESEYVEEPTITSKEKMFLNLILSNFKYIARDFNNDLYIYCNKPKRNSESWNDLCCIDRFEGIRQNSELKTVFKDGRIIHRDTFEEIRNRLNGEI